MTVNGAELKTMLENGVSRMPAVDGRFPQVSGLCFTYDIALAAGSRVTSAVIADNAGNCTATPVNLTRGRRTRSPRTTSRRPAATAIRTSPAG